MTQAERQWEKQFWAKKNPICLGCVRECKQSSKARIIECPRWLRSPEEMKRQKGADRVARHRKKLQHRAK